MNYHNLSHEEIIKKYHDIKKQMNILLCLVFVITLIVGGVTWNLSGQFIIGLVVSLFLGMYVYAAYLFYFKKSGAAQLQGLYEHITKEQS
jgi:hypothetical protein